MITEEYMRNDTLVMGVVINLILTKESGIMLDREGLVEAVFNAIGMLAEEQEKGTLTDDFETYMQGILMGLATALGMDDVLANEGVGMFLEKLTEE